MQTGNTPAIERGSLVDKIERGSLVDKIVRGSRVDKIHRTAPPGLSTSRCFCGPIHPTARMLSGSDHQEYRRHDLVHCRA
jgi:hypothetical protein